MIYLWYVVLVPVSLLLEFVIARPLSVVLALFATQQMGWCDNHSYEAVGPRLPKWLSWFMTPDNSLDGDATFERLNGIGYISKVKWLWRNPAYSFALRYLNNPYYTKVRGDTSIKDNDNSKEGWCLVNANGLFQFRLVSRIRSTNRCFYVNFGWNVIGLVDPNVNPKPDTWQATFVFSPRISGFR